jgi:hypothetical protein
MRGAWPLAALAAVVALPSAGLAWRRGFDGLYGQDAYAYFDYAVHSVRASLTSGRGLEPFFWPPGYPLLVALGSLVVGERPFAGQAVSLVMGALVPVATYLLARDLTGNFRLALLAGLLAALPGQLWQSSIVVMADTTGLACATFGAWAVVRSTKTESLKWLLAATALLASATLARWIYGLVAIPLALTATGSLRRPTHALACAALAAVLVLPVVGPSLVGLLTHPAEPAAFAGNFQVYSWSPLNAFRTEFDTAEGHLAYSLPNGLYYAIAPLNPAYLTPLLAPWALLGVWRGWRTHLPLLGWLAIVYAFHAGAPWQNFRFTLAYLPPVAILAATGLDWAWKTVPSRFRLALVLCVAVGTLTTASAGVRLIQGFIDRKNDELSLVSWLQAQTAPDARLLTFGPTLAFRQYSSLPTLDLFDLTPADLDRELAGPAPRYVLVDETNIDTQWAAKAPAVNLQRLRVNPGLTSIGTQGSYTLFRLDR